MSYIFNSTRYYSTLTYFSCDNTFLSNTIACLSDTDFEKFCNGYEVVSDAEQDGITITGLLIQISDKKSSLDEMLCVELLKKNYTIEEITSRLMNGSKKILTVRTVVVSLQVVVAVLRKILFTSMSPSPSITDCIRRC